MTHVLPPYCGGLNLEDTPTVTISKIVVCLTSILVVVLLILCVGLAQGLSRRVDEYLGDQRNFAKKPRNPEYLHGVLSERHAASV